MILSMLYDFVKQILLDLDYDMKQFYSILQNRLIQTCL